MCHVCVLITHTWARHTTNGASKSWSYVDGSKGWYRLQMYERRYTTCRNNASHNANTPTFFTRSRRSPNSVARWARGVDELAEDVRERVDREGGPFAFRTDLKTSVIHLARVHLGALCFVVMSLFHGLCICVITLVHVICCTSRCFMRLSPLRPAPFCTPRASRAALRS